MTDTRLFLINLTEDADPPKPADWRIEVDPGRTDPLVLPAAATAADIAALLRTTGGAG